MQNWLDYASVLDESRSSHCHSGTDRVFVGTLTIRLRLRCLLFPLQSCRQQRAHFAVNNRILNERYLIGVGRRDPEHLTSSRRDQIDSLTDWHLSRVDDATLDRLNVHGRIFSLRLLVRIGIGYGFCGRGCRFGGFRVVLINRFTKRLLKFWQRRFTNKLQYCALTARGSICRGLGSRRCGLDFVLTRLFNCRYNFGIVGLKFDALNFAK